MFSPNPHGYAYRRLNTAHIHIHIHIGVDLCCWCIQNLLAKFYDTCYKDKCIEHHSTKAVCFPEWNVDFDCTFRPRGSYATLARTHYFIFISSKIRKRNFPYQWRNIILVKLKSKSQCWLDIRHWLRMQHGDWFISNQNLQNISYWKSAMGEVQRKTTFVQDVQLFKTNFECSKRQYGVINLRSM
jgi:hypothetical protein